MKGEGLCSPPRRGVRPATPQQLILQGSILEGRRRKRGNKGLLGVLGGAQGRAKAGQRGAWRLGGRPASLEGICRRGATRGRALSRPFPNNTYPWLAPVPLSSAIRRRCSPRATAWRPWSGTCATRSGRWRAWRGACQRWGPTQCLAGGRPMGLAAAKPGPWHLCRVPPALYPTCLRACQRTVGT